MKTLGGTTEVTERTEAMSSPASSAPAVAGATRESRAIEEMRDTLLVALEHVADVGMQLREARDFQFSNREIALGSIGGAAESAEQAIEGLRKIALKCAEVQG